MNHQIAISLTQKSTCLLYPGPVTLRGPRFFVILMSLASLFLAAHAGAATHTVTNFADSGSGSLRATIAAANPGDEINFAASIRGTLSLTSGHLLISKNLIITGPGADALTIQRSLVSGTPAMRIFFISNGTHPGPAVKISGLTLANGLLTDTFGDGACIYNDAGVVELSNCYLRNNTAKKNGGAIYNDGAGSGRSAGIFLDSCTLWDNYAGESGGAIYHNGDQGGAGGSLNNCTLFRNGAGLSGRAVYSVSATPGNVTHFTDLYFRSCTVVDDGPTGNTPDNGTIFVHGGTIYPANSIFYSRGTAAFVVDGGRVTSSGWNLVQPRDLTLFDHSADHFSTDYPVDPAGLMPNGGHIPTLAVIAGPALDRGTTVFFFDARGRSRPYDFPGAPNASDGNDIGAFEADDLLQTGDIVTVNSLSDQNDGTCGLANCTLREAVERMNALRRVTGSDRLKITFGNLSGRILLEKELVVDGGFQIEGPGARVLAISALNAGPRLDARIFTIRDLGAVVISGLTLRDGFVAGPNGNGGNGVGGAVLNYGNLTLNDCRFENNRAQGSSFSTAGGTGGFGLGGAIQNHGSLVLNRCTLSNNAAVGGNGGSHALFGKGGTGGSGLGGAIANIGTLILNNCTLAGNTGTGAAGASGRSGGNGGDGVGAIYNPGQAITVTACTISGNTGIAGAGGPGEGKNPNGSNGTAVGGLSAVNNAPTTVRNSIIARNTAPAAPDVAGAFTSQGYNLVGIGDTGSGFGASGDQVGTTAAPIDPKLGSLKNDLGPTDTMELLGGSPALDAGNTFGLTSDQRGFARPVDLAAANASDGSDIGAFEAPQGLQPLPTPGLVGNVSTRLPVGTGDNVLIEGFTVQGPAGSTKKIIVRAIGPWLTQFGIADALANPTLEIRDGSNAVVATNDNWGTTQTGGIITGDQSAEISASGLAPGDNLESAIIANLAPGSYTAVVRGAGNTVGTGVVDAYDLSAASPARLVNVATRGSIQPGDKLMIAGFIVQNAPVKTVVRAIGPSLSGFGISNALPDTTLQVRDGNGAIVRENDDWQTTQKQELEATTLQPTHNLEAALIETLPPGQYTAQVRGKPETTGIGVVQVYFLE